MRLVNVRVFHVTRHCCHLAYTTNLAALQNMLEDGVSEVDTILVTCPDGYTAENIVAFQQIEYFDTNECYKYINVANGAQVATALESLSARRTLDDVVVYHHQVIV
jgi:hypothetical protein